MNSAEDKMLNTMDRDDEIDLRAIIGTLIQERWLIAGVTAFFFLAGLVYAFIASPVYESDVLIQVEQKKGAMPGLDDLSAMLGGGEAATEAEIEVIRSRSVLGAAVAQLGLDIIATPKHVPLIGGAIARRYHDETPAGAWLGFDSYAWGGERIIVQRLDVPESLENVPLTLRAEANGAFRIYGPEGQQLLHGSIGKPAVVGESASAIRVFVADLSARPGTEFSLMKKRRQELVSALQRQLVVSEKGKKTGIIQIRLEGNNPRRVQHILNTVSAIYVRQNVERRSEEAQKTLAFLDEKLPVLKGELDASETRLNNYRSKMGSVDLPLETQKLLEKSSAVEQQLTMLALKQNELSAKFTTNHPALVTLAQQRATLQSQLAALTNQIRKMPEDVQESIQMERDVRVANDLYLMLLNKAQELRVVKAGTVGNVRTLDEATYPYDAVKPKKPLILLLSMVLGVMLGTAIVFVKRALLKGVEDPDELERRIGLPTFASIPHSDFQANQSKVANKARKLQPLMLIAKDDLAVESIRSLRTAMQFALMDARNNIVAITGSSPGIGKSFIGINLAFSLAEAGKRTLLIDADMRKGHLHDYFDIQSNSGLSNLISGEAESSHVIHASGRENLFVLPRGTIPPNPAELLLSPRFERFLEEIASEFDSVIIDSPPVLAVTDAAIIGRLAAANFVVVRHAVHQLREVELTVKRLRQNGINPQGFIFNDVPLRANRYGQYGYHYQYRY